MNGRQRVTIKDVAAGVSTKTVSRVVNNQGEISEATRERVQAAIKQLDYRPNILARSLIHQRSNTVVVVAWRKIGIITGPMAWWEARERCAGWEAAMHQHNLATSSSLVFEGEWTATAGEQGLNKL